jgi:1-acyl-sn-glycerol-3-phosphate acyltransferase
MKIFARIRFYYEAFIITVVAGGIMIPLMFLFRDRTSYILHKYNGLIMKLIGAKIESRGKRDNSVDMFIINHQGIIDIIAMEAEQLSNIRWVAKKQLFDVPWFGNLVKLSNMISIDRENKIGLVKLFRDAKETKDGKPHRILAIFPEGTRNQKQKLKKFKSGAKLLAEKLELVIQPIVITNSKKLLNQHNLTGERTTVYINYLDKFKVNKNNKNWYQELQNRMQKVIDEEEKKGRYR